MSVCAAAVAAALFVGFGGGWAINGWRLAADVAETKAESAEQRAASANTALDQLAGRLDDMNKAASTVRLDVRTLAAKMDLIREDQKNAQVARPLDPGCRPDDQRLRNLREAVGTVNAAITGAAAR